MDKPTDAIIAEGALGKVVGLPPRLAPHGYKYPLSHIYGAHCLLEKHV